MKKVKLCLWQHGVKVKSDWHNHVDYAKIAMQLLNDKLVKKYGNLKYDFWFLSYKVKGKVHILANDSYTQFAENDPAFTERLTDYIEQENTNGENRRRIGN